MLSEILFCLLLVCIVQTSKAVKSIEIQLIRIEDIPTEEFKQASEVQNIQVATAGPGLVGLYVPLFMVLPRYFSCPSKVDKDCFARILLKCFNHQPVFSRKHLRILILLGLICHHKIPTYL